MELGGVVGRRRNEINKWTFAEKMLISTEQINNEHLQWFFHCPRPQIKINDNGGEFTGREFQELLMSYEIEKQPTTVLNPRSNGIKERMN